MHIIIMQIHIQFFNNISTLYMYMYTMYMYTMYMYMLWNFFSFNLSAIVLWCYLYTNSFCRFFQHHQATVYDFMSLFFLYIYFGFFFIQIRLWKKRHGNIYKTKLEWNITQLNGWIMIKIKEKSSHKSEQKHDTRTHKKKVVLHNICMYIILLRFTHRTIISVFMQHIFLICYSFSRRTYISVWYMKCCILPIPI